MLNRLQLFRNVGLFDSVSPPSTLALARMTAIYAENGRGKTTLSAILRSLATGSALPIIERQRLGSTNPPQIVIDCDGASKPALFKDGAWSRSVPNMAIFDDAFVDENICSGLVVAPGHRQRLHEFILGAQGVALNRDLQQAVEDVETHNRELRTKGDAIPAAERGNMAVDTFCDLAPRPDIDEAILEAERNLAAAVERSSIQTADNFDPILLPPIDVDEIAPVLATELRDLDAAATEKVQAHLVQIGNGGEAWVEAGMQLVASKSLKSCPFCAQDLSASEILRHYRTYFSAAYTELKSAIRDAIGKFSAAMLGEYRTESQVTFERAIRVAGERRQFWSRFTDIPEIQIDTVEIGRDWSSAETEVITALEAKEHRPLERMVLTPTALAAIETYEGHRKRVKSLSDSLQHVNGALALVREQAASGNVTALRDDVARLKAVKARHSAAVAPLCNDYLVERAAKVAAEERRDSARTALDQYRTTIFPAYQGSINDYLRKFNAGFRLDQITPQNTRGGSTCTYNVLINNHRITVSASDPLGQPSFRNSLSSGDRNTLALAFFFASLDQDSTLADKIVVIDDPVSSLDEHRSLTTVQEMRRLMQRVGQVIVLSHNKPFLCKVWDGTDETLRAAMEVVRDGDGSTIRAWDVSRDMITEHDRRHALLRNFVTTATPNNREVAESLRPVLEAFMRVAFPQDYPPGKLLGPFRGICEQRVGTPRQILGQTDIDELRNLTEYANRFHHDTNPAYQTQHINDAELLDFTRRTLAFAKR